MAIGTRVIADTGEVNVLTERVARRKREWQEAPLWVSSLRSRAYTASWQETEAQPLHIRRAKAFTRILEESPIIIRDGELIVGSATKYIRGADLVVEYNPHDILDSLKRGQIDGLSEVVAARIEDEEKVLLEEAASYWVGKSTRDVIRQAWARELGPEYMDMADQGSRVFDINLEVSPKASTSFNPRLLREGLNGTIARARAEKEKIGRSHGHMSVISPALYHKRVVLDSIIISCEAVIAYAERYAGLAESLAETETDPVRRAELEQIAEHCRWVPANPPRTFAEALQFEWFIHLALMKEQPMPSGTCPGRFDQYMNPFYESDLSRGLITEQDAAELLGCLWIKMSELEAFRGWRLNESKPGSLQQQITISGLTKEGRDATNPISFLVLEVSRQMKTPQPGIYIRWHNGIDHEFMVKAIETNRETGGGIPAFLNDQSAVNRLMSFGVAPEDAIEWNASGCLQFVMAHVQSQPRGTGMVNLPKVFEVVLHNGVDPRTGKQVGLLTGDVTRFTRIEEFIEAFEKQLDYFLDRLLEMIFVGHSARVEQYSTPMTSVLMDDCIERGLDAYEGGERYPQTMLNWGIKGQPEVADCLAAIKKLVLDDGKMTMAELMDALANDFAGREDVRQMCLQAPKYGNDDDYIDDIYNYITLKTADIIGSKRNPWTGGKLAHSRPAVGVHYYYGKVVGALPNGRKAYLPLYDAGLSPMQGADVNGPTALLNSATKVNHLPPEINGLVLNMKFSRPVLQARESIERFLAMMKTFYDRGGWHIQFNIVNKEELLEAQKHPEQWRHLVVRVAGYSAFFVDLPRDMQNEIIARTEHGI